MEDGRWKMEDGKAPVLGCRVPVAIYHFPLPIYHIECRPAFFTGLLKQMRLVSVAVPVPAVDALTYRVPDTLPAPVAGARVLVPLGTRVLTGVVMDAAATPPDAAE